MVLFLSLLAALTAIVSPAASEEKPAPERVPFPTELTNPLARVDAQGDPLPPGAVARLGSMRWRHGDQIQSVCFSHDGKRIASASLGDGSVRIWDAATGQLLHRFSLNQVTELALSENGKRLAAIGRDPSNGDQGVWVWDEDDQNAPRLLTKTAEAICLRFQVDQLWVAERSGIACWFFKRGKQVLDYKFKTPTRVTALTIFPGRKFMLGLATSTGAMVIDESGEKSLESPIAKKECATTIAFSPDGKSVAVGTDDGALYVWSIKGKVLEKRLDFRPHRVGVTSITYSPDGKQLISVCYGGECYRWNALTGDKLSKVVMKGAPPVAADAAFSPALVLSADGKRLAGRFAPVEGKVDHHLHVWDTANGKDLSLPVAGHGSAVWKMAFQSDGSLVSLSTTGELLHWNSKNGEGIGRNQIPPREKLDGVTLSSDGQVAWFTDINRLEVLDLKSDAKPLRFSQKGELVYGAAFSPDPNLLVTAYSRSLGLWSVKQKSVTEIDAPEIRRASNLAFSGDGKRLLVADKQAVLVWDVAARKQLSELKNVRSDGPIALSSHGQIAAVWATTGGIRIFDADNGQEFRPGNVQWEVAHDLVFAPDGRCLLVATEDGVHFVAPITGRELFDRLDGGQGAIRSLAINRDGTLLATGSVDGTILLWNAYRILRNGMAGLDGRMPLSPEQRASLWNDLASTDTATSYAASVALFDGGKGTVAFFRERLLSPKKPLGDAEQQRLLKQLADPDYKERGKAFAALKKIGRAAEPMLREAYRTEQDEIMHLRLRAFLSELELDGIITPNDDRTREMRVVQLLGLMVTPSARELLRDLAQKATSELLRVDAAETLQRSKVLAPKK
jgi:WD40 repeat protein